MGFFSNLGNKIKSRYQQENSDKSKSWSERNIPTVLNAKNVTVTGAKNFGNAAIDSTRNVASTPVHFISRGNTWILFLLVVILHIFIILPTVPNWPGTFSFSALLSFFFNMNLAINLCIAILAGSFFYSGDTVSDWWHNLLHYLKLGLFFYLIFVAVALAVKMMPADWGRVKGLSFALLFLAQPWIAYILSNPGDKFTYYAGNVYKIIVTLYIIAIIFLVLVLGGSFQPTTDYAYTLDDITYGFREMTRSLIGVATETPGAIATSVSGFWKGQIANATQEHYAGTVDQSQGLPIGVFITDAQPLYTKFQPGDDVVVTATITARTFSDTLAITNDCTLEVFDSTSSTAVGNVAAQGTPQPKEITISYTGEFQEKHAVDCTIKRLVFNNRIGAGRTTTGTVNLSSTFSFDTWGYAEYGFMDRSLMQAFRSENEDPALVLGLSPMLRPKYTPGPLMIGMPADTQPVSYTFDAARGVSMNNPYLPAFGVTFSNAWMGKGEVREFKSVEIIIPKPFKLLTDQCVPAEGARIINGDKELHYGTRVDWKEDGENVNAAYNLYEVSNVGIRKGESFITIRCPMGIDEGQAKTNPVLGSAGAGKFTFFVHANYIYSTWTRVPVVIQGDIVS